MLESLKNYDEQKNELFLFSIYWKTGIFPKYAVTSLCSKIHLTYSFLLLWYLEDTHKFTTK